MPFVRSLMIHPNNGTPKFWASLADGSCVFGSLVKRGVKMSASGGDPREKRRKGYFDVRLPAHGRITESDIEVFAALSVGSMSFASMGTNSVVRELVIESVQCSTKNAFSLHCTNLINTEKSIQAESWYHHQTVLDPVSSTKDVEGVALSVVQPGFESDCDYSF